MKPLSKTYKELGVEFVFPIEIRDTKGKKTYFENRNSYWCKREYDANGNETYFKDSNGYWHKKEYDADGNKTYYEDRSGYKTGTPRSQTCDGKAVEVAVIDEAMSGGSNMLSKQDSSNIL